MKNSFKLNTIASKVIKNVLFFLIWMLPKRNIVVLRGFPDFEDNLSAVYLELKERNLNKIIWVVDNVKIKPPFDLAVGTKVIQRNSLKDLFYCAIAKYLFITHGHFLESTPENQICVNLWHGVPLKRVGKMLGGDGRNDRYLVTTSTFTRDIFEKSFDTPRGNILIAGQPRTDRMINVEKEQILQRIFPGEMFPKFLFVWLPTYRTTNYACTRADGEDFGNTFNCTDFSIKSFNEVLKKNNAYCIVKPHPMAVPQKSARESNVFFIDENWLFNREISLYQLIGISDCLISDISSVIVDYMLLDKPAVLLFEDIDQYKENRGFSLNPITDYLPADVRKNYEEFALDIEAVLSGQDVYKQRRENLKRLFFDYADANATKRILDIVLRG